MADGQKYYISYHNAIYGPYLAGELNAFLTPGTLVCREGEDAWHAAGDVAELKPLLKDRAGQLEPDHAPGTIYFAWTGGKEYGPYSLAQVKEFAKPATPIRIGESGRWLTCGELAELKEFFAHGDRVELRDWLYFDAAGTEHGPLARPELEALIRSGELAVTQKIQHLNWSIPIPLGETKLYRELMAPPEETPPPSAAMPKREARGGLKVALAAGLLLFVAGFGFAGWRSGWFGAVTTQVAATLASGPGAATAPTESAPPPVVAAGNLAGELFGPRAAAAAATAGKLVVHMVDVGQGDGFIVQTPGGRTYVVDAGDAAAVIAYLKKLGVASLDGIMMSHPHQDHIGGMPAILDQFPCRVFYDPGYPHTSGTYRKILRLLEQKHIPYVNLKAGDVLDWGDGVKVEVVHPDQPTYENINNNSIVCRLTWRASSILFTGDAEGEARAALLTRYRDRVRAQVLKVCHHGSYNGTDREWLDAVAPEIALISCGRGNHYGHPHGQTMQLLESSGIAIYRTDQQGCVTLAADGTRWQATVEGTTYDRVVCEFPGTPSYRGQISDRGFLATPGWNQLGPPERLDFSDGGMNLTAEPEEQIYQRRPNGPLILRRPGNPRRWVAVVKLKGSTARGTDGAVVAYGDERNWVSFSIAEGQTLTLTNCRNGRQTTDAITVPATPQYLVLERFGERLNIAAGADRREWTVLRRYAATELGFPLDGVQVGLGANSWGKETAVAWFYEYAEYLGPAAP